MKKSKFLRSSLPVCVTVGVLAAYSKTNTATRTQALARTARVRRPASKTGDVVNIRKWGSVPAGRPGQPVTRSTERTRTRAFGLRYERFVNDDTGNVKLE